MDEKLYGLMNWPRIEDVVYCEESAPRDVMGPSLTQEGVVVQGFFPGADSVSVVTGGKSFPCDLEDEAGYFAVLLPKRKIPEYTFRVTKDGETKEFHDPYAFPGQITEEEEKAFCAGVYYQAYEKLGAHPMEIKGVKGTNFAVWAPNALRVSVVGDFNNWDGRTHMMHKMPMSGIFELFIPEVEAGELYKYEIKTKTGELLLKSDSYAAQAQEPPYTASVVADVKDFQWKDEEWMDGRKRFADRKQPMSIYETSLTDWASPEELLDFLTDTGYTHVELLPVMEYLNDETEGYSTSSYFAVTSRFGTPQDFCALVDMLHQAGIGVILDWNPAQFPRIDGGLELFDGTPLYEEPDEQMKVHPFWGTLLYNYASPMVKDFLISNACYWLEACHVDGLRMDDVDAMLYLDYGRNPGEWKPNLYGGNENLHAIEFLKHLNSIVKLRNPGVLLIAQEDGLWPELTDGVENDHLGFDYKWSGGWTHDFLEYLAEAPDERKHSHDKLTLSMLYAYCEHFVLTLGRRDVGKTFEEFADRIPGNEAQKAAQIRNAYAYMMLHPGCKMMAMESTMPEGLSHCIHDLNELYKSNPALYTSDHEYEGFEWIQLMKYEERVISFLRKDPETGETLLAICNFSDQDYKAYKVGVPFYGKYKEIFNSDDENYGGTGMKNLRAKTAKKEECDEREYSVSMKLPAFSTIICSCVPEKEKKAVTRTVKKAAPGETKKTAAKTVTKAAKKSTVKTQTAEEKASAKEVKEQIAEAAKKTEKKPAAKAQAKTTKAKTATKIISK